MLLGAWPTTPSLFDSPASFQAAIDASVPPRLASELKAHLTGSAMSEPGQPLLARSWHSSPGATDRCDAATQSDHQQLAGAPPPPPTSASSQLKPGSAAAEAPQQQAQHQLAEQLEQQQQQQAGGPSSPACPPEHVEAATQGEDHADAMPGSPTGSAQSDPDSPCAQELLQLLQRWSAHDTMTPLMVLHNYSSKVNTLACR
jgi:hypothetical protein